MSSLSFSLSFSLFLFLSFSLSLSRTRCCVMRYATSLRVRDTRSILWHCDDYSISSFSSEMSAASLLT